MWALRVFRVHICIRETWKSLAGPTSCAVSAFFVDHFLASLLRAMPEAGG